MKVFSLLSALCSLLSASGADYYVNVVAGNNASAGTAQGTAWQHLPGTVGQTGAGWVVLQAGDTVWVKGDTTNNAQVIVATDRYNGGLAVDSIQIRSGHLLGSPWGSSRAVFDQENTRTFGFWVHGTLGEGQLQGVTLDGFEIRNIKSGGVGAGFDDTDGSCGIAVGGTYYTSHLTIRNCWIHDSNRDADDRGHGIEFGGGTNTFIYHNQIGPKIGTKGIEVYGTAWGVISNNYIWDFGDHGVALSLCTNWDVCNNVITGHTNNAHTGAYCVSVAGGKKNDIWNNLLFQSEGVASSTKMGVGFYCPVGSACFDNRFVWNTVVNLYDAAGGGAENAVAWGNDTGLTRSNQISGNIVFRCTNAFGASGFFYYSTFATNSTLSFNCWGNTLSDTPCAKQANSVTTQTTVANFIPDFGMTWTGNVQVNPGFTGGTMPSGLDANFQPNTLYFSLSSPPAAVLGIPSLLGSSAYGFSSAIGKFSTDIIGATRSAGAMGAYEFSTSVAVARGKQIRGLKLGKK